MEAHDEVSRNKGLGTKVEIVFDAQGREESIRRSLRKVHTH